MLSHDFWQEKTLLRFMLGSLFSTQGVWIQRLTLGWMTWSATHSETWVGLIAFFNFFPTVVLGPVFGVLADRVNVRAGVVTLAFWNAFISAGMAVLIGLGYQSPYLFVGFALLLGLTTSMYQPLRLSLVPDLVKQEKYLQRAVASNSIIFNTSRFIGPAVAGVVINHWGNAAAFVATALFYLPMPLMLMTATLYAPQKEKSAGKPKSVLEEFRSGLGYVRKHEFISCLLLVTLFTTVFARAFLELLPALVQSWFNEGVAQLAILTSSAGIAAVVSGLWLSGLKRRDAMLRATRTGSLLTSLVVILLGSFSNFYVGVVAVALLALCSSMAGIGSQTLLQMNVDRHYRGRVMSLWGALIMGGASVGSLLLGSLMELVGNQPVMLAAGVLSFISCLVVTRRLKQADERLEKPPVTEPQVVHS
ncbi:MFS transporter [Pokkaliibacter sp. CJK22405]|uniref:MFS transporter n=1 Tax=Pokkaliibacter sp. CJK22405 TaxID=3384615 RepID=UPI003984FED6